MPAREAICLVLAHKGKVQLMNQMLRTDLFLKFLKVKIKIQRNLERVNWSLYHCEERVEPVQRIQSIQQIKRQSNVKS